MTERRRRSVLLPSRSPIKKLKGLPNRTENGATHADEISTWVQCERKTCLKWRRITGEETSTLRDGEPWYCRMNRDVRYNLCTAREEKAKKPKHMKFVYSLLPVGDVVMARMSGYPPWPGLLTSDPSCDEYYDAPLDRENQITHYHVEFLGTPRSHAWLVASLVHPFASVPDVDKCPPQFKNIQGRKLVEMKRSFNEAMVEARRLLKMTQHQRLATCRFKSSESNEKNGDLKLPTNVHISSAETTASFEERTEKKSIRGNDHLLFEGRRTSVKDPDKQESEFVSSLQTFMAQQGRTVARVPAWRGQRINLFKLYTTVQEHGGYENVCRSKLWAKIYNSLVDEVVPSGKGIGSVAGTFYQKSLLPFEEHLKRQQLIGESLSKGSAVEGLSTWLSEDVRFIPTKDSESVKQPMRKRGRKRKTSYPVLHEETQCEQTVPEQSMSPTSLSQDHCDQLPMRDFPETRRSSVSVNSDCVASSNPNSPLDLAVEFSSDSEDDSSTTFSCDVAEQELRYLEKLLTALEPSLYPRSGEEESNKGRQAQRSPVLTASYRNIEQEEVDVTKTLDEIADIEEEIAELDTFVALGLDKL